MTTSSLFSVICLLGSCIVFCFFFKQKTAYEMRISDWSSDVCSSDLAEREALRQGGVPDNQARSTRTANQARDTREQAEPRADLAERFRRQSDVQNAKDPELRKAQSHVALAMAVAAERFPSDYDKRR